MTESIRSTLVSALRNAGVCLVLSEAETKRYPFVTYEMTVNPIRDKDGVHGYTGLTTIRVVSDDTDQVDEIRAIVEDAIETSMRNETYSNRLTAIDKDCLDGVWTIELSYTFRQIQ